MAHVQQARRPASPEPSPGEDERLRKLKRRKSLAAPENSQTGLTAKVPIQFLECDKEILITIISRMLMSIIETNDKRTNTDAMALDQSSLTRFHSRSPPQISIFDYLVRLSQYSMLNHSVLITAVYYVDLLSTHYPTFALNSLTVHRFLLTATTVASKALCDSFCSNSHYAKVGGVNIIELNLLEVEFLSRVKYRVVPRDFNYDRYRERKSSSGTLEDQHIKDIQFGIGSASTILDLYYSRMVDMMGNSKQRRWLVGHNDSMTYVFDNNNDNDNNNGEDDDEDDDDDDDDDDDYDDYFED